MSDGLWFALVLIAFLAGFGVGGKVWKKLAAMWEDRAKDALSVAKEAQRLAHEIGEQRDHWRDRYESDPHYDSGDYEPKEGRDAIH